MGTSAKEWIYLDVDDAVKKSEIYIDGYVPSLLHKKNPRYPVRREYFFTTSSLLTRFGFIFMRIGKVIFKVTCYRYSLLSLSFGRSNLLKITCYRYSKSNESLQSFLFFISFFTKFWWPFLKWHPIAYVTN